MPRTRIDLWNEDTVRFLDPTACVFHISSAEVRASSLAVAKATAPIIRRWESEQARARRYLHSMVIL